MLKFCNFFSDCACLSDRICYKFTIPLLKLQGCMNQVVLGFYGGSNLAANGRLASTLVKNNIVVCGRIQVVIKSYAK